MPTSQRVNKPTSPPATSPPPTSPPATSPPLPATGTTGSVLLGLALARLVTYAQAQDWTGVVRGLDDTLRALGVAWGPTERAAFLKAITIHLETAPITDPGPPYSPDVAD